ncbi:hypothetical protein GOQ30_14745 [Flavobacterium sp. TP390]|uniref:Lipoprotein n=1 Tax=Flavobacterium profundi TaxID=1774945 RepID=A0A6I4IU82_9FLAO|nr:hypothetical protein [Flavobacterium profundi]MVO10430.1 hypothetical protein [Flavobacterium profundi]
MKNIALLAITSLFLFSCSNSESLDTKEKTLKSSKPNTLKQSLVNEMIQQYRNNQLATINKTNIENDAHSIWFELETLKKFITDVENEAKKNGNTSSNDLGIRFYYAAYPEKVKWGTTGYEELSFLLNSPITQQYENKHTLVMIPTIDVEGKNVDFNPMDKNTFTGFQNTTKKGDYKIMSKTSANSDITAQNHGNLIPPADPDNEESF